MIHTVKGFSVVNEVEVDVLLELLQQCENFFGIIVFQFVGRLLGDSVVGLLQEVTFSKRTCATH